MFLKKRTGSKVITITSRIPEGLRSSPSATMAASFWWSSTGICMATPCSAFPVVPSNPEKILNKRPAKNCLRKRDTGRGPIKLLGERYISPGLFHYIDTFFLATDLVQDTPRPGETEEFIYHYRTPAEIDRMMASGEILSGNATCAWTLARPHFHRKNNSFWFF